MARLYEGTDWRYGIAHSRLFVMVWSADEAKHGALQRQKLAYAQQHGKPIRLLRLDDTRLPEDLCAGYADVQVARVHNEVEAAGQIHAWLAELPPPQEA